MLKKAILLVRRFLHVTLRWTGGDCAITDAHGQVIGRIASVRYAEGRVDIAGWCNATKITLVGDISSVPVTDRHVHSDPLDAPDGRAGFTVAQVWAGQHFTLECVIDGQQTVCDVPYPPKLKQALAVPMTVLTLLGVLWAGRKDLRASQRDKDEAAHARIVDRLGLNVKVARKATAFTSEFFSKPVDSVSHARAATIIIPIYNAFDLLPELLARIAKHTDIGGRVLLVEDASTDPRVRPYLQNWCSGPDAMGMGAEVQLIENAENLGFIGSVNRAFSAARQFGDPIILLNSDAMVPPGWASRLLAPLERDTAVASVTPLSNDAEIFSAPEICRAMDLLPDQVDAIDGAVFRNTGDTALIQVPTGVGFCMAMRAEFFEKIPSFDTVFGRGYGEEVDWCQKARGQGGVHLAHGGLFVEHRGGSSFGSEAKRALVAKNNAIVAKRYPGYDQEVQDFIRNDPLAPARLSAGLAWALSSGQSPLSVYVAHWLGGGAEHYLQRRLDADLEDRGAAVVLRVGGPNRWQIELHTPGAKTLAATDDDDALATLFAIPGARRLIYSCAVGDTDPVSLPDALLSIVDPDRDEVEILFHDFFPISPAYTLLGQDGRFTGVPSVATQDPAHQTTRPNGAVVSLAEWRDHWGAFLSAADDLVVFSTSSRDLLASAYPHLSSRIRVRPHVDGHVLPQLKGPENSLPSIGILGDIGFQKGAAVVADLGGSLPPSQGRITIIGRVDPNHAPPAHVTVHGRYDLDDLPEIAAGYGIDRWFIPSIWPETFCYTVREALSTGLPVFCFDLGGQAEGARAHPNGVVLPASLAENPQELADILTGAARVPEIQSLERTGVE